MRMTERIGMIDDWRRPPDPNPGVSREKPPTEIAASCRGDLRGRLSPDASVELPA